MLNLKDSSGARVHQQAERLTAALYLVTGLVSDRDPLKWTLRSQAVTILSDITIAPHDVAVAGSVRNAVATIVSLLDVACSSRVLSEMNCTVLREEYGVLFDMLSGELPRQDVVALPRDFFSFDESGGGAQFLKDKEMGSITPGRIEEFKGQFKGHDMSFKKTSDDGAKRQETSRLLEGNTVSDNAKKKRSTSRRDEVIAIVKKRGKAVSVKDISDIITDCSEKTLQRELLSLVEEGVLKKTGERRWSKYSLA